MSDAVPDLAGVAAAYAETIVAAVRREYPNALRHVMHDDADTPTPRGVHPAFYGCYDWHSAVEMYWALVRMLRVVPDALVPRSGVPGTGADAAAVRAVLDEHLTADALQREADYLVAHPNWERPYGWAWVLALVAELETWAAEGDADAARWAGAAAPLAEVVTQGFVRWLPGARYPVRVGMHSNSAFALTRALPHARARAAAGEPALLHEIADAAVRWFGADIDYPAGWEPSAADFLSPALAEAELIAALAEPPEEYPHWLDRFLPHLADARPSTLFTPVTEIDGSDGQAAHLHGLNLHRAHVFGVLADLLGPDDRRTEVLRQARHEHAAASLPVITGSDWMVEHWLAAYAVLLLG